MRITGCYWQSMQHGHPTRNVEGEKHKIGILIGIYVQIQKPPNGYWIIIYDDNTLSGP
jgi:hypothetical protein